MTEPRQRVLVVDDEQDLAESCLFFLQRAGYEARTAFSGEEALALLASEHFDVVVTDVRMPRMSGLALLDAIKERDPDVEVVLITAFPEIETAVSAIKQGAFDYVAKPFTEEQFLARVEKALAHRHVKEGNVALKARLRGGTASRRLVYRSAAMGGLLETLERAARTEASVLIQGESGTGKELLAHHLHDASPRAGRPFVPVDCTTIPEALFESELFGHKRGAFSGALTNKSGLFEVADGGTLFLDEVGELPLSFQPKFLRALQERQIRKVGANSAQPVDVRIVCATNRNLQAEVEAGRFRQDLYYRLDVVRIEVPPLRQRPEDIDVLAQHFLAAFRAQHRVPVQDFAPEAVAALRAYSWPGNVRQLRNVIERACALGQGQTLGLDDLPAEVRGQGEMPTDEEMQGAFHELKHRKMAAIERGYVENLLRRHRGNVTHSAEEAGISRQAFQKLMLRYEIKSSDFRDGAR
ncbi:MAG: sigma-54-dependent Fis family transcriptional regulator [Planctomycetes bacterium]|nr:sigma-54-dependent Fis family transcriptional regulator [Planctomycetota bacterium]